MQIFPLVWTIQLHVSPMLAINVANMLHFCYDFLLQCNRIREEMLTDRLRNKRLKSLELFDKLFLQTFETLIPFIIIYC